MTALEGGFINMQSDNNDDLIFSYGPPRCMMTFNKEFVQEIIFMQVNTWDIKHFWVYEDENAVELSPADHYLKQFTSLYDMVMVSDDEIRFMGFKVKFKSGMELFCDLNLTSITSTSPDEMFEFVAPVFEAYGYTPEEMRDISESLPCQHQALVNKLAKPQTSEGGEQVPF